ncbi:MAG: ABC transporter ATP-binding protein [Oscillospiraceae bacterium]|nr:ABC transporter ATP-binding protein [Oscillospiraceae bacterium]
MSNADVLLELKAVETFIGQYHILFGVDLVVERGKATIILGRNGAGKTTTLRTIMGLGRASAGSIVFDGKDITQSHTHHIVKEGVSYVPEDRDIFSQLTIEENLHITSRNKANYEERLEFIFSMFPDMKKYFKKKSRVLSGGQAQMLSISRALINENKLMMIDEPSKGLAPIIIRDLIVRMNEIKKDTTVLMVEQNYEMALAIGDHFCFIEDGKTVFACDKQTLLDDESIKTRYLGV